MIVRKDVKLTSHSVAQIEPIVQTRKGMDDELVARARRGDRDAFAVLVRLALPRMATASAQQRATFLADVERRMAAL